MKTAEEKVNDFLVAHIVEWNNKQERELIKLLKEQDRDTRHACAESIIALDSKYLPWNGFAAHDCDKDEDVIRKDQAHNAIMNTKAV